MSSNRLESLRRTARLVLVERRPLPEELWTALLAGIVGVAGSFAYGGPTTDFVAVPVTDAVVAYTPGILTAASIQLLGKLSEYLPSLGTALGLAVIGLGSGTLVGARVGRRLDPRAGPLVGTYFGS